MNAKEMQCAVVIFSFYIYGNRMQTVRVWVSEWVTKSVLGDGGSLTMQLHGSRTFLKAHSSSEGLTASTHDSHSWLRLQLVVATILQNRFDEFCATCMMALHLIDYFSPHASYTFNIKHANLFLLRSFWMAARLHWNLFHTHQLNTHDALELFQVNLSTSSQGLFDVWLLYFIEIRTHTSKIINA